MKTGDPTMARFSLRSGFLPFAQLIVYLGEGGKSSIKNKDKELLMSEN